MNRLSFSLLMLIGIWAMTDAATADEFRLSLRTLQERPSDKDALVRSTSDAAWNTSETAIIVCDVWDKHHCLNAVRRMEEFLPRMNDVLTKARDLGAIIIHSPSDCMPAYEGHAARKRAIDAPIAANVAKDVAFWCSKIPTEEQAAYPIDQSDGGEDDDPAEHAKWAAELKALGRNPGLPWQSQNALITIDADKDFISDRGDEVWNILESRGVKNVILVGVHTNMCVLGRPFGLRRMVRNGKNVVLMRDLTDCMYNPRSWPFVDHFTGNDLIIAHVERFVCPTITSDQIIGGQPFLSKYDTRSNRDLMTLKAIAPDAASFSRHWTTAAAGSSWRDLTRSLDADFKGIIWYRCSVRLPSAWLGNGDLQLKLNDEEKNAQAWFNGLELKASTEEGVLIIPRNTVTANDIDLLVVRIDQKSPQKNLFSAPLLQSDNRSLELNGRWQFRVGDDPSWKNIPLPAKFGLGSDVLFEPR